MPQSCLWKELLAGGRKQGGCVAGLGLRSENLQLLFLTLLLVFFFKKIFFMAYTLYTAYSGVTAIACSDGTCFPISERLLASVLLCQGMSGSALRERTRGQGRSVELWHVIGKSSLLSSCRLTFWIAGSASAYKFALLPVNVTEASFFN